MCGYHWPVLGWALQCGRECLMFSYYLQGLPVEMFTPPPPLLHPCSLTAIPKTLRYLQSPFFVFHPFSLSHFSLSFSYPLTCFLLEDCDLGPLLQFFTCTGCQNIHVSQLVMLHGCAFNTLSFHSTFIFVSVFALLTLFFSFVPRHNQ